MAASLVRLPRPWTFRVENTCSEQASALSAHRSRQSTPRWKAMLHGSLSSLFGVQASYQLRHFCPLDIRRPARSAMAWGAFDPSRGRHEKERIGRRRPPGTRMGTFLASARRTAARLRPSTLPPLVCARFAPHAGLGARAVPDEVRRNDPFSSPLGALSARGRVPEASSGRRRWSRLHGRGGPPVDSSPLWYGSCIPALGGRRARTPRAAGCVGSSESRWGATIDEGTAEHCGGNGHDDE